MTIYQTYNQYDSANANVYARINTIFSSFVPYGPNNPSIGDFEQLPTVIALRNESLVIASDFDLSYQKSATFANDFIGRFSAPGGTAAPDNLAPPGGGSYANCNGVTVTTSTAGGGCLDTQGKLNVALNDGTIYSGAPSGVVYQLDNNGNLFTLAAGNSLPVGTGYAHIALAGTGYVTSTGVPAQPVVVTPPPSSSNAVDLSPVSSGFTSSSIVTAIILIAAISASIYLFWRGSRIVLAMIKG